MSAFPLGSHGNYPRLTFPVPLEVRIAAREGLALRRMYKRGGTQVGWARARQLSMASTITLRDAVHMRSYFRRHAVDRLDLRDPPSNGWIAWLLWGGHPGQRWVERIVRAHLKDARR